MTSPVVVKLGGDALASPQRIVTQARRLAARAHTGPVVAVVSARRGVTDHLLQLTEEVAELASPAVDLSESTAAEADRAVASGEVVAAALLALALNRLGVPAVSLDAREARVRSHGAFGAAHIRGVDARPLLGLLADGIVPVVTGFQGWARGRVTTIGRGGTDASAVAVARAIGADRVVLVKDAAGLRTADPKLLPEAVPIPEAPHRFLTALARAGSRVVQLEAAQLAEQAGIPLEFWSLEGERADTRVHAGAGADGLLALATSASGAPETVTVVAARRESLPRTATIEALLVDAGFGGCRVEETDSGCTVAVPEGARLRVLQALHQGVIPFPSALADRLAS